LVVCDGMRWNEVVSNYIPFFEFVKNAWSEMEHNGIHSIPYHSILQYFIPPNLGCMQWNNAIIKILPILPLSLFYHCNVLYSSQIYSTLLHFFSTVIFHIFVLSNIFHSNFVKQRDFVFTCRLWLPLFLKMDENEVLQPMHITQKVTNWCKT